MLSRLPIYILLLLGACTKHQSHTAREIEFRDWYVVDTPNGGMSAAYGKIRNRSTRERVIQKVEISCASRAELHETIVTADRVRMEHLDRVIMLPGELINFQPGKKHIMLHETRLGGLKSCDLRLAFAEGQVIQFRVPIKSRSE